MLALKALVAALVSLATLVALAALVVAAFISLATLIALAALVMARLSMGMAVGRRVVVATVEQPVSYKKVSDMNSRVTYDGWPPG